MEDFFVFVFCKAKNKRSTHREHHAFLLLAELLEEDFVVPLSLSIFLVLVTEKNIFQSPCVPDPVSTGKVENSEKAIK